MRTMEGRRTTRTSVAVIGALGFALASTQVLAGEVLNGTVDMIDEGAKMITVDGQEFMLEATHELTDVEVGEKVTLTYEEKDGEKMVQSILPAEPNQ